MEKKRRGFGTFVKKLKEDDYFVAAYQMTNGHPAKHFKTFKEAVWFLAVQDIAYVLSDDDQLGQAIMENAEDIGNTIKDYNDAIKKGMCSC